MRHRLAAALWLIYAILAIVIFAGFIIYRPEPPQVFRVTIRYVAGLVFLLLLLASPALYWRFTRRVDPMARRVAVAAVVVTLAIVYFGFSNLYYRNQQHLFDPFLQAPPIRLPRELSNPEVRLRVVAMGGSTTNSGHLPDSARYPNIIEAKLKRAFPDSGVRVFNAGANWWTTKHSLINYVTYLRDWQPDVVLIMHAVNDMYRSFAPSAYAIGRYDPWYSHFYGPAIQGVKPPSFPRHLGRVYLGAAIQGWYRPLRFVETDYPPARFVSLPQYERNLRTLVEVVRADGAMPVLLTEPSVYSEDLSKEDQAALWFAQRFCNEQRSRFVREYPSTRSLMAAMRAYNDVVRKVAASENVLLIDVDAAVPRTLAYFVDDVHYTEAGSRLIGEMVGDTLQHYLAAMRAGAVR